MRKGGLRRLFTPFGITQLVLLAAVGVALWLAYLPWRWERTKEELRNSHPAVSRIDTESLKKWVANKAEAQPVLIDVRPQAEYDFSHLPGALNMALSDTPALLGFPANDDASFVVYDAVGKDAFPVAASLAQRRYARVQVLEGGIFEWANRDLPLEGEQGATGKVLAGNSKFAALLKRRARAD
jgi:rhodanese-related sulfurtransferase